MPLATFEPPIGPSPGASHRPTLRLLKAEFGDGYTQAVPNGLNHIRKTVRLKWGGLTMDQMQEIVAFFETQGGHLPFYYETWGIEGTLKWTCEEWDVSDGPPFEMTATLVQSFTLET